jgi:hypothetical protein
MEFLHLDCLVAPEDIGAVCDVRREDGAIRCRRYMVTEVTVQRYVPPIIYKKCWMRIEVKKQR